MLDLIEYPPEHTCCKTWERAREDGSCGIIDRAIYKDHYSGEYRMGNSMHVLFCPFCSKEVEY